MIGAILDELRTLPARLSEDEKLVRKFAGLDTVVLIEVSGHPCRLVFHHGALQPPDFSDSPMRGWDFALRASAEAWKKHWQARPEPGFHDIFALAKGGQLRMEGNFLPLMRYLQAFKDLLALPREPSP